MQYARCLRLQAATCFPAFWLQVITISGRTIQKQAQALPQYANDALACVDDLLAALPKVRAHKVNPCCIPVRPGTRPSCSQRIGAFFGWTLLCDCRTW